MPISVCKGHSNGSLIEIYEELYTDDKLNPIWKERANAMIQLIHMINDTFIDTQIWGLTSHYRLALLSENHWDSAWHVIIENPGNHEYYLSYIMPQSPWPDSGATVHGVATSLEQARKYLIIAMNESHGWEGNEELRRLLETVGE